MRYGPSADNQEELVVMASGTAARCCQRVDWGTHSPREFAGCSKQQLELLVSEVDQVGSQLLRQTVETLPS